MKYRPLTIIIAVFVFMLSACAKTEIQSPEEEKIVLTFYLRAISKDSVTGELIEAYNTMQDRVTVEFEVFGENYKNVISIALLSNDPPDIFELNGGLTIDDLVSGEHIIPIDDYLTEDMRDGFYPDVFTQNHLYHNGALYTIPERLAYFKLFYNKDLFDKAGLDSDRGPESLEEMVAYAKVISEKGQGEYYGYGLPLKTTSTFSRYLDNIAVLSGVSGKSAYDWDAGEFNYNDYKPFMDTLIMMKNEGSLYPDPFSLDVEVSRALFGQGAFAMMIDGSWMPAIYNNGEVEMSQNWAVAEIPIFSGTKRQKGIMTYDMGRVIASSCPYPDEAWAFINYMLENQDAYVRKGEPLRTMISTNDPTIFPEGHTGYLEFSDVENYRTYPFDADSLTEGSSAYRNDIYRSVFLEEMTAEEGFGLLNEAFNK